MGRPDRLPRSPRISLRCCCLLRRRRQRHRQLPTRSRSRLPRRPSSREISIPRRARLFGTGRSWQRGCAIPARHARARRSRAGCGSSARLGRLFEEAAAKGHAKAAYALAAILASGDPRDPAGARRWLERAAALGDPVARDLLRRGVLPLEARPQDLLVDEPSRRAELWRAARRSDIATLEATGDAGAGECRATTLAARRCTMRRIPAQRTPVALLLAARCEGRSRRSLRHLAADAGLGAEFARRLRRACCRPRRASQLSTAPATRRSRTPSDTVAFSRRRTCVRRRRSGRTCTWPRRRRNRWIACRVRLTTPTPAGPIIVVAASRKDPARLRELLARGADAERDDSRRRTAALLVAVRRIRPQRQRQLLAAGADVSRPGRNGETPLDLAVRLGRPEVLEVLLRHGAEPGLPAPAAATRARRRCCGRQMRAWSRVCLRRASDAVVRGPQGVSAAHAGIESR